MTVQSSALERQAPSLLPLLGGVTLLAIVAARRGGLGDVAPVETFAVIFASIVIEALPFVLLGATVSAAIEVFVPDKAFAAIGRLPMGLQLPAAAMGGFAFPVCECGSVPVARRLISKGMHPAAGLAFMLASPILNPVVLISTAVAYSGRDLAWQMVLGRAGLGFVLALVAGWAIGADDARDLLRPRADDAHDHGPVAKGRRSRTFFDHLGNDFFFMGRFVVLGAALAAVLQTVIPQDIVSGIARTPIIGTLSLMGVAFVLSLCSEADAFVAVSFVQFPLGSQLAFLVFGPVVDAKLAFLYGATFRKRFVSRLVIVAIPVVLAGSLWFQALVSR